MFSALSDKDKIIVIDAMEERNYKPGDCVIKKGDAGDELFIVEQGRLDCFIYIHEGDKLVEKKVKEYEKGETFGELSLLYNTPRAATIKALTAAKCWSLDRETFNNIVKDAAVNKRQQYEEFLRSVPILSSMISYERDALADALKEEIFEKGQAVILEGSEGDKFYMVEEGTAKATKNLGEGREEAEVMTYKKGDYFGEKALLN